MTFAFRILTAFVLIFAALHANTASAACSNPSGVEGEIVFNDTSNVPEYCDNTNWIAMVGGDPTPVPDCPAGITSCGGQTNERVVFLTSPHTYPSITNTYDKCASEAAAAGLKGTYYAWYARTNENDPESVYEKSPVPYVKVDGIKVADDWADLTDGTLDSSINTFASGNSGGSTNSVWTFVLPDGTYAGDSTCTTSLSSGLRYSTNSGWTTGTGSGSCSNAKRLYCFEQGQPTTKIVPNGLLGHWRLDETSGTTVYDSSGNGYGGTMIGGPTSIPNTVIGNGRNFGNGDRIDITHGGALDNLNQFTISAWVFRENNGAGAQGRIMAMPGNFMLSLWNNSIRFTASRWSGNEGVWRSGADLPSGQWHHYVVTYDYSSTTNNPNVYFNGEPYNLSRTSAPTGSPTNVSSTLNLGNDPSGLSLRNTLDDVRIYNRIISPEEVAEIYAARDGIRYNENYRAPEYFDGNQFVAMPATFPEPGKTPIYGCQTIGETCANGTIYAGLSTDGDVPMFVTATDAPGGAAYSWNAGNASGASMISVTADPCYSSGQAGCKTGELNTNDAAIADSDTATGGVQDHLAAKYCYDLSSNGFNDWYLPAQEELAVLYANRSVGDLSGTFATSYPEHTYWTSSEVNNTAVQIYSFDGSGGNNATKENTWSVRCVRKGNFELAGSAGLVGHWKFDETKGTIAYDSSGNGINGTMTQGLNADDDSIKGAVGTALNFLDVSGSNNAQRVDFGSEPSLNFADDNQFTLSLWVKRDNSSSNLFERGAGCNTNNGSYCLSDYLGQGQRYFFHVKLDSNDNGTPDTSVGALTPSGSLVRNRWQHIVARWNGTVAQIFIDGVLSATSSSTTNPMADNPTAVYQETAIGGEGRNDDNGWGGGIDDVRAYNRALSADEITQLYQMGTPAGSSTALPQGCPNVGDICDDGTIYAGLSPDGNVEMFAAAKDSPNFLEWNNGNNSGFVTTNTTSNTDGDGNTNTIVRLDSDTGVAGFQPHKAAQYCYDLNAHSADDWYLPALNESLLIFDNLVDEDGDDDPNTPSAGYAYGFKAQRYATSTELNSSVYTRIEYADGSSGGTSKQNSKPVRCVRKGPAPRCANPYGIEGQMIYNSSNTVVQYCDGARWVAIGKEN